MAGYRIPYADYVRGGQWSDSAESGQGNQPMSEERWNALSLEQQFDNYQGDFIEADEADAAAFRDKFGAAAWDKDKSGRPGDNRLVYSWVKPGSEGGWKDSAIDSSRVLQLPDGRWVTEADNVDGTWLAKDQEKNDTNGELWALAPLAIFAAAYALPASLFAEGASASGSLSGLSAAEVTAGTAGVAEGEAVGSVLATGADTSLMAPITAPEVGSLATAPVTAPAVTAPAGLPPVVNSVPAVPGTGGGIINGAISQGQNAISAATGWVNNLSPASRLILGQAISSGAQGLLGANAQRNAQEAADEREEQERQDTIRRGSVPDFSSAFKPKTKTPSTGIIDGLRIPRPGS